MIRLFLHALCVGLLVLGLACSQGPQEPVPPARVLPSGSPVALPPTHPEPPRPPGVPAPPAPTPPRAAFAVQQHTSRITWELLEDAGRKKGGFNRFRGDVDLVGGDPSRSSLKLEIDVESLYSDDPARTSRWLAPDALDAGRFPTVVFESTEVLLVQDRYEVRGDLTLHGVRRRFAVPVSVQVQPLRVLAEAEFSLDLREFGLGKSGPSEDPLPAEVVLRVQLEATPAP